METLDLTFLASGALQHVFVETIGDASTWVYKIPGCYPELLPAKPSLRFLRPVRPYRKLVYWLIYDGPRHLEAAGRVDGAHPLGRAVAAPARLVAEGADMLWNMGAAHRRRRTFRRMLQLLGTVARRGAGDVVLPFEVSWRRKAILRIGDAHRPYDGPVLRQRRADHFFTLHSAPDGFDWGQLVRAQHRFWRAGLGVWDAAEILGPHNWAILDGEVRLGDTGSLTDSFERIMRAISDPVLDAAEAEAIRRFRGPVADRARAYFAFVRREINPRRLAELWRSGTPRST